jgi:Zn-dependent peptidase ImmA (M78 family)
LRKLAQLYRRPLAVFYLPGPPKDFDAMKSFRRHPNREFKPPSLELAYQLREVEMHREVLVDLAGLAGEALPRFPLTARTEESPRAIAERLREKLGISIEQQYRWTDEYDALHGWRHAIEALGVLVFQVSRVKVGEMRGFSIYHREQPIIAVNSGDAVKGRIFSLIHELAHLALGHGELCDDADSTADSQYGDTVEVFCNAVAGETLVPGEVLEDVPGLPRRGARTGAIPLDVVHEIAGRFKVSEEVVLLRLLSAGRISREAYQQRRKALQARPPPLRKSKGGPSVPVRVVSSLGVPYVRAVLDALHSDRITLSDVSDYLGVRVKHLPKIETFVLGAAAGAET